MVDETLSYREIKKRFWRWPSLSLLPVPRLARRAANKPAAPDTTANVRGAVLAMLIAFALFLVFGSRGLRHFTRDLPGNAVTDVMVNAADRWHALMLRLGPAHVAPAVWDAFEQVRRLRW